MSTDQPSSAWLRERAQTFVRLVAQRGMVVTVDAAEILITDRTGSVAQDLGTTRERAQLYLNDDVLSGLAEAIIASLEDEQPGIDPLDAARTSGVRAADLGHLIAGLAESVLLYTTSPALDTDDRHLRVQELIRFDLSVRTHSVRPHRRQHPGPTGAPSPNCPLPRHRSRQCQCRGADDRTQRRRTARTHVRRCPVTVAAYSVRPGGSGSNTRLTP